MKTLKKLAAVTAITGISAMALTGCVSTEKYDASQQVVAEQGATILEQADELKELSSDVAEYKSQLSELTSSLNTKDSQLENFSLVIEDLNAELEEAKAVTVIESGSIENADYDKLDAYYDGNFSVTLDDGDLDKLIDSKISFNDDNIDVKEQIVIDDSLALRTSLTDEDFCETPYLIVDNEKSIKYNYVFDDQVNITDISEDESLKIKFLGKDLEIVGFDGDEMLVKEGKTAWIIQDNNVDGVMLVDVDENGDSAGIQYGEEIEWIDEGDEYEFDDGTVVRVNKVIPVNSQLQDMDTVEVTIHSGDVIKEIKDGDEYVDDDETWVWSISKTGDVLNSVGVEHDVKFDDLEDEEGTPLMSGESISLPESYVTMTFQVPELQTTTYDFEFDEYGSNDIAVVEISSSDDDGIVIGIDEVDKAYFNGTLTFYTDSNGDDQNSTTAPKLVVGDTELDISIVGDIINVGSDIDVNHTNLAYLGGIEDESEASEIVIESTNVGSKECEVVSTYGIVFDKAEDSDEFSLIVPEEQVETSLIIK